MGAFFEFFLLLRGSELCHTDTRLGFIDIVLSSRYHLAILSALNDL
jgi:hypothetical protein